MPWENILQLEARLSASPARDRLEQLYALSTLVRGSVYSEGYVGDPVYSGALKPSDHGVALIEADPMLRNSVAPGDLALALLCHFYHLEPLLDAASCDVDAAINQYSQDLLAARLRLPHRFGRVLYDKFNDTYHSEKTNHIDHQEVAELLGGTEQGVYQVGQLVTGPLGVLKSSEQRFVPPVLNLPLWHCSDTGCSALHNVTLRRADVGVVKALRSIQRTATDRFGLPSEWPAVFSRLHRHGKWPSGRPYNNLAALIGDAVLGTERTALVAAALTGSSGALMRDVFGQSPRKRRAAQGPPESLASSQSEATQLQLLLLLTDEELVSLLDSLVSDGRIRVPSNEVRRAILQPPALLGSDRLAELSLYGVRSVSKNPLIALATLVFTAYEEKGLLEDLAWRCDRATEVASVGMLLKYMRAHSPHEVLRSVVLPSRPIVSSLAKKLSMELVPGEDDEQFIQRALWKAGFTVARYDGELARFRSRLESFNATLLRTAAIRNEDDREVIRSAGVNVFVSVEHLLEELIAFNVWLLSSDHFLNRFRYNGKEAVRRVGEVLGSIITTGTAQMTWSSAGGNMLGVLMAYLTAAKVWMAQLSSSSKAGCTRADADRPHFADDPERQFPFDHTELWADATPDAFKEYVNGFSGIAEQFERSDLATVRNGLDHKRDPERFPSLEVMLACCARLLEAFNKAEVQRYLPKTYWLNQKATDQYGRYTLELRITNIGHSAFTDLAYLSAVGQHPTIVPALLRRVIFLVLRTRNCCLN